MAMLNESETLFWGQTGGHVVLWFNVCEAQVGFSSIHYLDFSGFVVVLLILQYHVFKSQCFHAKLFTFSGTPIRGFGVQYLGQTHFNIQRSWGSRH